MIAVDPPPRDYRADFWSVSGSREGQTSLLLTSAATKVFRAYDRYVERSADASALRPLRANVKTREALKSNYPSLRGGRLYGDLLKITEGR